MSDNKPNTKDTIHHHLRNKILREFHKLCNSAAIYSNDLPGLTLNDLKEEEKTWYWFSLSLQAIREELKRQLDVPVLPYAMTENDGEGGQC